MDFAPDTKVVKSGNIVVLYGEGGTYKTSMLAQAIKESKKNGLFCCVGEEGLAPLQKNKKVLDLEGVNRVPYVIKEWSQKEEGKPGGFKEFLYWAAKQKFTDIAIDSLTMIMKPLEDYCFKTYYTDNPEFHGKSKTGGLKSEAELRAKAYGYGKSDILGFMRQEWDDVFIKAINFFKEHNINVWISCHSMTKKGRNIGEELEFDYQFLDMPYNAKICLATGLYNCADVFLYAKKDISTANSAATPKGKGKVIGTGNCVFVCEGNVIKAKNRGNMPEQIKAEYEELKKYL